MNEAHLTELWKQAGCPHVCQKRGTWPHAVPDWEDAMTEFELMLAAEKAVGCQLEFIQSLTGQWVARKAKNVHGEGKPVVWPENRETHPKAAPTRLECALHVIITARGNNA